MNFEIFLIKLSCSTHVKMRISYLLRSGLVKLMLHLFRYFTSYPWKHPLVMVEETVTRLIKSRGLNFWTCYPKRELDDVRDALNLWSKCTIKLIKMNSGGMWSGLSLIYLQIFYLCFWIIETLSYICLNRFVNTQHVKQNREAIKI